MPGCESDTWEALTAPPDTSPAVVAKLNGAVKQALRSPELREHFKTLNLTPGGGSPADMAAFIKQETERWGAVIRAAGIKPE